jgi:hypothetical protein
MYSDICTGTMSVHVYDVRPRKGKRGVDLFPLFKCRMIRHNSRRAAFKSLSPGKGRK